VVSETFSRYKHLARKFLVKVLLSNLIFPISKPWVLSLKRFIHQRPNVLEVVFSKRREKNFDFHWCHALWALVPASVTLSQSTLAEWPY
jgi:hypothetical protein